MGLSQIAKIFYASFLDQIEIREFFSPKAFTLSLKKNPKNFSVVRESYSLITGEQVQYYGS